MKKSTIIVTALLLVSFIVIALYFAYKTSMDPKATNSTSPVTNEDALKNQDLASKVREEYYDFPIYYGDTRERKVTEDPINLIIESIIADELQNVVFWHYDEFEEDGFTIEEGSDINNTEIQTILASKENIWVNFTAEKINENETFVKIILTKHETN